MEHPPDVTGDLGATPSTPHTSAQAGALEGPIVGDRVLPERDATVSRLRGSVSVEDHAECFVDARRRLETRSPMPPSCSTTLAV